MTEIWKDIEEYKGLYQVSNNGRIKSLERVVDGKLGSKRLILEQILVPLKLTRGYLGVRLYKDHKGKTFKIHRLVAKAFIENVDKQEQINHKDGVKSNNNVVNLEWVSNRVNMNHALENNLVSSGTKRHNAALNKELLSTIQPLLNCGLTSCQISLIFGLDRFPMSKIITGKAYINETPVFVIRNKFNKKWKVDPIPIKLYEVLNNNLRDNTVLNSLIAEGKLKVESQCNAYRLNK
jgi:hypothetical protein